MSPTVANLHRYVTTLTGAASPGDMQTIAYVIGGAFLLFAASAIWRALTSKY